MQEKNITYPTDSKRLYTAICKLGQAAHDRGIRLRQTYLRVDKGYRGHGYTGSTRVPIAGSKLKNDSRSERRRRRRRSAIEPKIGYLKIDHRMNPGFKAVVHVDAERMKQVLRNLVSNAVKFSPRAGHVNITVGRSADALILSLRDQGPGVPEAELESVFDKFVQSSKTRTGAGGTGLGLAICRQLVAAHRGHIWVENNVDRGTTFKLKLPLRRQGDMEQYPVFTGTRDGRQEAGGTQGE